MIKKRVLRTCFCLLAALAMTAVWMPVFQPSLAASGADIDITSKAVSKDVVKLNWSTNRAALKKVSTWKIRRAEVNETTGKAKEYVPVKSLSKGTKSCSIKNLNANTHYRFEVTGYVKKKGKQKLAYMGKEDNYTGIAAPKWDDRATCDDSGCSEVIRVVFQANQKGLAVKGYEIQRRTASKKNKDFKKLATVKDSDQNDAGEIIYKDKSVEKGSAYQYRIRAYIGKKNKTYSPFSGVRTRYAVDKEGQFTIRKESLDEKEMILRFSSNSGNADLVLDAHDTFYGDMSDENENPIYVKAYSRDGKKWTKLVMLRPQAEAANVRHTEGKNFVTLKSNKDLYLKFVPVDKETDLSSLGRSFYSQDISYNGYSSKLSFTTRSVFGGKGKGLVKIK